MLAGLVVGCECVVRERDEVEPVAAVVADIDEGVVCVGLRDGSDRPGRPSAGAIAGSVVRGTAFDPDNIAELFWTAHTDPTEAWQTEYRFTGA